MPAATAPSAPSTPTVSKKFTLPTPDAMFFAATPEYSPNNVLRDIVPRFIFWLSTFGSRYLDFSPPAPTYEHEGEFPTIENVPWHERCAFWMYRGPVYFFNIFWALIKATYMAFFSFQAKPTSDAQLSHIFSHTVYCKFLKRTENVPWLAARSLPLSPPNGYWYYTCDFSFVPNVKTYSTFFTAETRGVFKVRKDAESKTPEPVAIWLAYDNDDGRHEVIFKPGDIAWEAAKLFLLQGANHMGALVEHPKVHFPYDSINAFTHHLPVDHVLRKLLAPHQMFTLPLNDMVLNSAYLSIVVNPLMIQSPFDAPADELRKYLRETKKEFIYSKIAVPDDNVFSYGTFLRRYFIIMRDFVGKVVDARPNDFKDMNVAKWAENIATIIPGFPNSKTLLTNQEMLKDVLAQVMWNLSVHHGADHYTFYCIPWQHNPWRIRLPPPLSPNEHFDFTRAHASIDIWKLCQTQEVFFYTGAGSKLGSVDYGFAGKDLQKLNREFRAALAKNDTIHDSARVMELSRIGMSIDY